MNFNHVRITSLQGHIARTKKELAALGVKVKGGKPLTATEHRQIEKARADLQTFSLRLQHEQSLAGTFGPRPY